MPLVTKTLLISMFCHILMYLLTFLHFINKVIVVQWKRLKQDFFSFLLVKEKSILLHN